MLKNPILPIWVEEEGALSALLASPFHREDRKICITRKAEYAKALTKKHMPCIFMEIVI